MWQGGSLWIPGSQWDQQELHCTVQMAQNEPTMAENEPKMSQNDQNACKMRVKARHGHKRGALRVHGRSNWTLFGQIWFVFSFIGLEKGPKMGQRVLKRPERPQRCSKMPQNASQWPKMGQNGSK